MTSGASDQIRINAWEVHGEGREFENISNDLSRAVLTLEQGLAGATPWGTDEPGHGFGTAYGEAKPALLTGLHGLANRLGGIGIGLHSMADSVQETDTQVAADFNRVDGGTGSGPAAV